MSKSIESMIECPFYIEEKETSIICEGSIKNTTITHVFRTDYEKENHEVYVCSENQGKNCPHYQLLMEMYEEGVKK